MTKVVYICEKTTDLLLKARGENVKSPDTNELIRMNADAIAPLVHISFEIISQRRRDAIKPNVNKNDATLCASHIPVTKLLFGDEFNHIRLQIRSVVRRVAPTKGITASHNPIVERAVRIFFMKESSPHESKLQKQQSELLQEKNGSIGSDI